MTTKSPRITVRGRIARTFAAAAVVGVAMMPVGALATPISDSSGGTVEAQRIVGICEQVPRLPFFCVG